ncbi:hypothetical protein CR205_02280 [Alteribacter lacisalsi]|uniref:DUF2382 domain-containing protein n=1 Tax=Alteribacter lacisalsi TaxID=2045244 RepID=A0A2W0HB79_9BACI|nr:hypothetical protein CR205_02280 [Alteribacter lacisalsi]
MGILIGGLAGWITGYFFTGIVSGAVIGGLFYLLKGKSNGEPVERSEEANHQKFDLKEEELDIRKKRVVTGDVKVRKEVVETEKTLKIPVKREEMVIETADEEEIRIPVKEEEVHIRKQPVKIAEVDVTTEQVEEMKTIKAPVKKEVLDIDVSGDADVKENNENH